MNVTPDPSAGHTDLVWPRITCGSESGRFIEDHLSSLVHGTTAHTGRFRVDVVHPDLEVPEVT